MRTVLPNEAKLSKAQGHPMLVHGAVSRYHAYQGLLYDASDSSHSCPQTVHTSNTVLLRRDSKPTVRSKLCDPDESCPRGGLSERLVHVP